MSLTSRAAMRWVLIGEHGGRMLATVARVRSISGSSSALYAA
jgi:hypothetical protein